MTDGTTLISSAIEPPRRHDRQEKQLTTARDLGVLAAKKAAFKVKL
jgi:hypothetical protein